MQDVNRMSAVALGLAAASAAMVKPASAQTTGYKDATPWPGVVVRAYDGETPSLIPSFKTVSMRDVIVQPGSKTMGPPMMNAMAAISPKENFWSSKRARSLRPKRTSCGPATKTQKNRCPIRGAWSQLCGSRT